MGSKIAKGVAVAAAMALLGTAAPAAASTATWADEKLTVTGTAGADDVLVGSNGAVYDAAGITAGPGCSQQSSTEVTCGPTDPEFGFTIAGDFDVVAVDLGAGNDEAGVTNSLVEQITISGGDGDDDISATSADTVVLRGGAGNDTIRGYTSDDKLFGDAGADTLIGGDGNDEIDGGAGRDTLQGDGGLGGSNGNDRIRARDGERDTVSCDLGADIVTADRVDVVEKATCESVAVPAATKRQKALARCKKMSTRTKAQRAKRATCLRKARRIRG